MMVEVKIGTIIQKENLKAGTKKDGSPWLYGLVSATQGYDKIKVWASNSEVGSNSAVTVTEITQAKITNRKYTKPDGTEAWATEFNVEAKVEPIKSDIPEGFSMISDDQIPF